MTKAGGDSAQTSPRLYLYHLWKRATRRCTDPRDDSWHRYGGRGIRMHQPWIEDYMEFRSWVLTELGDRPTSNHSMDRIDNDGNYEPGNLRWATRREQALNQSRSADDHNISFNKRLQTWGVSRYGLTKDQAIAYRDAGEATL